MCVCVCVRDSVSVCLCANDLMFWHQDPSQAVTEAMVEEVVAEEQQCLVICLKQTHA